MPKMPNYEINGHEINGHEIIDEGWRGQDWVVTCSCGDKQTALHSDIGFWQWLDHAKEAAEAVAS